MSLVHTRHDSPIKSPAPARVAARSSVIAAAVAVVSTVAIATLVVRGFRPGTSSRITMRTDRMMRVPLVVLWAWERREDLSFIDPRQIAVAYLDRTLELSADTVVVRPRLEPLMVPAQTVLIPLARVEIDWRLPPSLSAAQRSEVSTVIAAMAAASPRAIQIDFDATRSERAFYRDLLADVRGRIPASIPLSMTALVSWCLDDDWISGLAVDEAVPMLYRMGPDAREINAYLRNGGEFVPASSRSSVGLSLDEQVAGLGAGKRVYLFSPRAWTEEAVRNAMGQVAE